MLVCHMTHCGGTTFFGDVNKGLLTTDTELIRMDQSTNSTNIQLGKPMSCIGITNMYITIMYMWGRGYLHNQKWLKMTVPPKPTPEWRLSYNVHPAFRQLDYLKGALQMGSVI